MQDEDQPLRRRQGLEDHEHGRADRVGADRCLFEAECVLRQHGGWQHEVWTASSASLRDPSIR